MPTNHIHKPMESQVLGNHSQHVTSTIEPFSHVTMQTMDRQVHNVPTSQATGFHALKRQTFVNPDNAVSGSIGSGASSQYTLFEIPKSIHIINGVHLEWQNTWTSSASGENMTGKPSWLQIDYVEIYVGGG